MSSPPWDAMPLFFQWAAFVGAAFIGFTILLSVAILAVMYVLTLLGVLPEPNKWYEENV